MRASAPTPRAYAAFPAGGLEPVSRVQGPDPFIPVDQHGGQEVQGNDGAEAVTHVGCLKYGPFELRSGV
jgi:hypothetical protein